MRVPFIKFFPRLEIALCAQALVFDLAALIDDHLVALEHELTVYLAAVAGGVAAGRLVQNNSGRSSSRRVEPGKPLMEKSVRRP